MPDDSPAWSEVGALLSRRAELTRIVDRIDVEQREATEARERAAAAVVDLERRAHGGGEDVTDAQRQRAEAALGKARAEAAAPWAERRLGGQRAVADLDREIQRLIGERFDDLVAGLVAQGEEAARDLDAAASAVIAAHHRREAVASRLGALVSVVRRVEPGDVSYSRAEPLVRSAEALLGEGGERPVELRRHDVEAVA